MTHLQTVLPFKDSGALLLYFGKPFPAPEPAITYAPGGAAILSNHPVSNLRLAFLPDPIGSYYRFETTFRARTRDNSKNYSESGLRCPAAPCSLVVALRLPSPVSSKSKRQIQGCESPGFGRTGMARCATTIGQRFLISPERSDVKKPHLTEENERAWRATTHRAAAMSRRFERFDIRFS